MHFKHVALASAALVGLALSPALASAQGIPVYDASGYLQAVSTVSNTLTLIQKAETQITTAENQLQSLQKLTNINSIASNLSDSTVRNILPSSSISATTLLSGNTSSLGSLGTLAKSLQNNYTISSSSSSSADSSYAQALKDATGKSATKAALGENTLSITQTRMDGLETLRKQLDSAKDPKDVMDIQARIAVEQAHAINDLLKLESIRMAEEGQQSLSSAASSTASSRDSSSMFSANATR